MSQGEVCADPTEQTQDKATAIPQADPRQSDNLAVLRIESSRGWVSLGLRELWGYRELIYFFIWRDIKVRYKQTLLGGLWAILQPFFTMLIFSVFFGRLAKIPSEGVPYPLFAFAALVPWQFFANGLSQSSTSLVASSNLVAKVYFPRLALPTSKVLSGVVDFLLAFAMLIVLMVYYGVKPTYHVFWLPFFFLLALTTALGVSIWFSALHVQFRDVQHAIPFVVQAWLFATPVAYPSSLLSDPWRTLYGINPMVGVVEGFRWALLGTTTAPGPIIAVSSIVSIALLVSGTFYFRRLERVFADIV